MQVHLDCRIGHFQVQLHLQNLGNKQGTHLVLHLSSHHHLAVQVMWLKHLGQQMQEKLFLMLQGILQ